MSLVETLKNYIKVLPVNPGPRRDQRQDPCDEVDQGGGGVALVPPSLP